MKKLILTITALLMSCGVCWAGIDNPILDMPLTSRWMNGPTTVLDLGSGANDGTSTDVVFGSESATFNGTTSVIDTGADMIGTGADSISAWIYLDGWGDGGFGRIVDNGAFACFVRTAGDITFNSDNLTVARSAASSLTLFNLYHICVTRTATGIANIYINGILSGGADQDSGTPVVGAHDVLIGNRIGSNRTFDGQISDVRIYDRALTPSDVAELYALGRSSQRGDIQGVGLSGVGVQ